MPTVCRRQKGDQYRAKRFESTVRSVKSDHIMLNETIFYAFSGRQESDHGTIGGFQVLEVQKKDLDIIYIFEEGHNLQVGDHVTTCIDPGGRERR